MEAAMRSHNCKNKRRSRSSGSSRKPLADCTNLSQTSSTSSTNNSSSFPSSFEKPPIILSNFPNAKNKHGSTHAHKSTAVFPPSPSLPPQPPPLPGIASDEIVEPHSVYTRRQSAADKRKSKGKAIDVPPISFTPAPKTQVALDKKNEVGVTRPSKSCTVHRKKKQCGALSDEGEKNHGLPQDFVERQRAYFAEIDAFELSEEEVGSSNELD